MSNPPSMNKESKTEPLNYLALGDSYTIGESVAEDKRWPLQLAERLRENEIEINNPKIIATTGWRTDQLKAAIESDSELLDEYDLVSLLIGVNNQYQGRSVESFAPEFEELLQKAIELAGGDKEKVFVVSIPDYGKTPFGASKSDQIARELDEYNAVSLEICSEYNVKYFNITPISRQDDPDGELVAGDNLHPSGKQYSLWVESFYSEVLNMVNQ
ncbi:MAG: SGNH/GDSL hydrolase family protein [Roseivirga sp.]|nr:SGNH/GDSL hydrolase family protein [Roseivirga sp.]MBO6759742.1 SGNH/GDSL hydrolase family protein [Roseivirga sp.]MBO6907887.1 SGNH/GDSL hydrolase family protein [Roseivirga sp.]